MEEDFPSAIETSASFSSLLGECSGRRPGAPALRPAQLWSPAGPPRRTAGPSPRPAVRPSLRSLLPRTSQRPPPPAPGTEFPGAAGTRRACPLASERQVIKSTRGWIFNHEADRRLPNAAPSPQPGASGGGRGPGRPGLSRPLPPTGRSPAEGLFQAGGLRGAGLARGGALALALINWSRSSGPRPPPPQPLRSARGLGAVSARGAPEPRPRPDPPLVRVRRAERGSGGFSRGIFVVL